MQEATVQRDMSSTDLAKHKAVLLEDKAEAGAQAVTQLDNKALKMGALATKSWSSSAQLEATQGVRERHDRSRPSHPKGRNATRYR